MEIQIDTKNLDKLDIELKKFPKEAQKSIPAAINRTLSTVNTKMQREITTKYKLKKSDLSGGNKYKSEASNNLIKVKKASAMLPEGRIEVRGSTLTLSRFLQGSKTPVSYKGKTQKQIKKLRPSRVQVKRGSTKSIKGSFLAKARGGTMGIFIRDLNGKLKMLHTLSVAQMASNKEVAQATQVVATDTLNKRIEHEIEYRINKMAGEVHGNA